tara:strand:- start:8258 stop:8869 length:612 start_codon:yes stop_codon:yes gene_type:complete
MKIDEALMIFYQLRNNTEDRNESIIYSNFITILLDLQKRDFNSNQRRNIETKLLSINLKNNLNKELASFEYFLHNKFSIISEDHYVNMGMAVWLFSSIILFYFFGQTSVIGALLVAIIFGEILDIEAKDQGRVIKTIDNQQEPIFIKESTMLNDFSEEEEEEEKHQKDLRKELQNYRRNKLQQFGKEQVQVKKQEQNKEEQKY